MFIIILFKNYFPHLWGGNAASSNALSCMCMPCKPECRSTRYLKKLSSEGLEVEECLHCQDIVMCYDVTN